MTIDATVGGAASDSYVTTAEFDAYATAMGWTATITEAALRRARLYLDRVYTWRGIKATDAQALQWPRYVEGYVDGYPVASDIVPQAIKDAQCELAFLALSEDLFATITAGAVTSERKKVDVIEKQTTYAEGSARDRAGYPSVDALLGPYIMGKAGSRSGSIPLARA